jgi:hypothetical protein
VFVWSKRLRPRHIGGRLNRIVGLANICLPHQILPKVRPTQILRPDFNCIWQRRRAGEDARSHLIFRDRATNRGCDKGRFDSRVHRKATVVDHDRLIDHHGLAQEDGLWFIKTVAMLVTRKSLGRQKTQYCGSSRISTRSSSGGKGAQPTYRSPRRQSTHAGPHSRPGTQAQPMSSIHTQRP